MNAKSFKFTGISRSFPQHTCPDGSCQEIVNVRFRKNSWRPIGEKVKVIDTNFTYLDAPINFNDIYLHDIEGGIISEEPNWIGKKITGTTCAIYLINPATKVCTLIDQYLDATIDVNIVFLKRTMIVTTGSGMMVYLYGSNGYGKIGKLPVPYVNLYCSNFIVPSPAPAYPIRDTVICDYAHANTAVLGTLYAGLNQQSSNFGRLYGSIMYMVAYRLFDGSFIMHSIPRYKEISNGGLIRQQNPDGSGWGNANWRFEVECSAIVGQIVSGIYDPAHFEGMKDIVDSVIVFATKATPISKIDETTITDKFLQNDSHPENNYVRYVAPSFPLNSPDFDNLVASSGWYQILEFTFSELLATTGTITKLADTKGFYQDYATRRNLTTDQFSHHQMVRERAFVYNDRLHTGSIKTIFGEPYILWEGETKDDYSQSYDTPGIISVELSTSLGKFTAIHTGLFPRYMKISDSTYHYLQPGIIGYNDSRATKMTIALDIDGSGNYHTLMSVDLKKNVTMNFAYWHKTDFAPSTSLTNINYNPSIIDALGAVFPIPASTPSVYDENRMQVSEIQNPLVYPAKYSYQIGTGKILAMAAGSQPLTQGQFGLYPLQIFTTKGIWTMQLGSADVLYQNVLPLNGEVVDNAKNVVSVGDAVVYSTLRGLYIISGMDVTKISENIEGLPHGVLTNSTEVLKLTSDNKFVPDLGSAMSDIDFLEYMKSSSIGFDQVNKELIVTNPNKGYSYIFSFENKIWYKISHTYTLLINNYPKLYGQTGVKIVNISDDDNEGNTQVLIISNALNLDEPDIFKKIERLIGRTLLSTQSGSQAGFYIFATNDLQTYQFVTGRQHTGNELKDFIIQRSPGSSKYYVIVFAGHITHQSEINHIDIMLTNRLINKLR